ncbi:MAG: polysaccharide deacetylase family protein [Acidobacteriota bacterium]
MSKKEMAALLLGNPLAARLCSPALRRSKGLRILAYHRILDDDPRSFAFDEALISARRDTFREQMKFVRRNFDVISFEDLRRCEMEGREWPRRALIITFDDGYRDNYTHAFPIMKEFHLPATVFLTTGYIGSEHLFWWDRVAYLIKHTSRRSVTLVELSAAPFDLSSPRARRVAIDRVLWWLKQVSEETRSRFLDALAAEMEVELPEGIGRGMHLSWDEIEEMARSEIQFGSHTITHPILSHVGESQLQREISLSKQTIEQHLGRAVVAFAYPAGRRTRFNDNVQSIVARCGYSYAVSYEEGAAVEGACDRFALPRIHVEADESLRLFRANLIFPNWMLTRDHADRAGEELASAGALLW